MKIVSGPKFKEIKFNSDLPDKENLIMDKIRILSLIERRFMIKINKQISDINAYIRLEHELTNIQGLKTGYIKNLIAVRKAKGIILS